MRALSAYQPLAFLAVGWAHRRLILRLAQRKVEARYRGSVLGLLWTLLHPLLMLAVYTFVFSYVFQVRWQLPTGGDTQFALFLFSGIITYTVFSECVNEAPHLMLEHRTYITQIVFPTEIFAWVSLSAALFGFAVNLLLLGAFYAVAIGPPPATALCLPLVLFPLLLLTLGAVWLIASLGVFLRDISQLVGVATTALLFLSPVFYPASRIPEAFRGYYGLNPFTPILEMSKGALFYGAVPDWERLALLCAGAWLVAWLGYLWFVRTKRSFADVL